jgi:glycosyltransferase involved in cell wall biosynthesis
VGGKERELKIALYEMLVTVSYGGIQTSYWETAKRLCTRGHEVHLYGGEGDIRWDMPDGVKICTFPFVDRNRFPDFGTRFRKFAERLSFGRHALASLIRNRYDVIYIRKPYEMPISLYVKRRTGAKVVYRSGGTEFFPGYRYLGRRLDAFLACSRYNASQIVRRTGIEPGVLHNGVDVERFFPRSRLREEMDRFGLGEDDFILMSVGRLVGWKGNQVAIRALPLLGEKRIKYMIVGDGEYRDELVRKAVTEAVGERVIFTGAIPAKEMPALYSLADVVLFPTIGDDDAFPNTLCEAMASGKPAIGSMRGGIPEGIVEGETGFLVPPDDPAAIADRIRLLSMRKELLREMGEKARRRAVEHFSWDIIVERLERIFSDLQAGDRDRP